MGLFTVHGRSPGENALRFLGVVLISALVGLAFWKNSERNMARLHQLNAAQSTLVDEGAQLDSGERARVLALCDGLRATYGLELRIVIAPDLTEKGLPQPPQPGSKDTATAKDSPGDSAKNAAKTVYLGLSPQARRAVVVLPPLVRQALGPEFARSLAEEHFPLHFAQGDWKRGLVLALELLNSRLAALNAPQTGAATQDTKSGSAPARP